MFKPHKPEPDKVPSSCSIFICVRNSLSIRCVLAHHAVLASPTLTSIRLNHSTVYEFLVKDCPRLASVEFRLCHFKTDFGLMFPEPEEGKQNKSPLKVLNYKYCR